MSQFSAQKLRRTAAQYVVTGPTQLSSIPRSIQATPHYHISAAVSHAGGRLDYGFVLSLEFGACSLRLTSQQLIAITTLRLSGGGRRLIPR